jgi:hypothetical protein
MRTNTEGIQLREARAVVNEVLSCRAFMLTYRDGVWVYHSRKVDKALRLRVHILAPYIRMVLTDAV